ncbi:MAG TPA: hypothetical protein PLD84_13845, partial [Chitinophagales bacterium]|nr:hypothetical protein [Chitinophagales bacterium]
MSLKLPEKTVPYVVYVILFITPFLVYWPLWIHPQAMAYDMADYFLPCRHFIGECLQQGEFPWWNPYSGLGTPIAADPQSGAFYPITWIIGYFLGYDFFTINLDYLFHLAIAGWGMYALLRGLHYPVVVCLLLAWSYQFCGFFVNNAQHFSWIISATWMPFFFHYYRQTFLKGNLPDAIRTALSLFMITTGGYPAFLIILIYLVGGHCLFFLIRNLMLKKNTEVFQWLKWSAIVLCIYLLITAPFILSFLQGLPLMTRGEALVKDHTLFRAFTPQSIITFLLPAVPLGQPEAFNTDTSMDSAYIGLVGILFFLTGALLNKTPVMRIILFLSLLILLVAFGDALPLWTFLFDTVPLLDHIRFPAAFRLFVIIGFILIAAEGMRKERVFPSKLPARIGAILIILLLIASVAAYATLPKILLPDDFSTAGLLKFFGESTVANNIVLKSVLQILLLAAILTLLFHQRWQSANWYFLLL